MKPYLLMLLLAIPPVVSNFLASEGTEPVAAPAPAKPASGPEATPAPAPRSDSQPATPAPKPAPAGDTTACHKALFL